MGIKFQSRKMTNTEVVTMRNLSDKHQNVSDIPRIIVTKTIESGESLTTESAVPLAEEEKNKSAQTGDFKTQKSVIHDKSELRKAKLKKTNRVKRESKLDSSLQSWQKTFVKRQNERQIRKDKVLSRILETKEEPSDVAKKTSSKLHSTKTPVNLVEPIISESSSKVKNKDRTTEQKKSEEDKTAAIIKKYTNSTETANGPGEVYADSKEKEDKTRKSILKTKTRVVKRDISDKTKADLKEVLKRATEMKEINNANNKNDSKVSQKVMEVNNTLKNNDNNNVMEKYVPSYNSFKKRQKYGNDLRRRIGKKWNMDESNRRVVYSQTYGKRKESVNNIQTLVKEEKAKRQVSFSSSGLPRHKSNSNYFDKDNSFARFHEPSDMASIPTKGRGKLSAIVKPMPSKDKSVSLSVEVSNNRSHVVRSPTFTKEAPEVLQYNRNSTRDQPEIGRKNSQGFDSRLKYKPHIHRRSTTSESVHLYTEVNVPVKRDFQKNFDSFVLLDKNFDDDTVNVEGKSSPDRNRFKTQRRLNSQNTTESQSRSTKSGHKSSQKPPSKEGNISRYSTSPMLEIVFQPDLGDVYVSDNQEQTSVYIKSGKVSAILHRGLSAPSVDAAKAPMDDNEVVRRSKVILNVC